MAAKHIFIVALQYHTLVYFPANCITEVVSLVCDDTNEVLIGDTCFIVFESRFTWYRAKRHCENGNLQFAHPKDAQHIRRALEKIPIRNQDTFGVWIGANDLDLEGHFIWIDTFRAVVEDIWVKGYPMNKSSSDDCAYVDASFRLRDAKCHTRFFTLCAYSVNEPTWFGDKNQYMCRCAEGGCSTEGDCRTPPGRCAPEWFGQGCQFKTTPMDIRNSAGVLQDNDDSTCLDRPGPLEITFKGIVQFTWMRIVVKEKHMKERIYVTFPLPSGRVKCKDTSWIAIDDKTVDIRCYLLESIDLDSIDVEWKGEKSICSIYLYAGKNIALKQQAKLEGNSSHLAPLTVDGRYDPGSVCPQSDKGSHRQSLTITLSNTYLVSEVLVYRRKAGIGGFQYMEGFEIDLKSKEDIFSYQDQLIHISHKIDLQLPSTELVSEVVISLSNVFGSRSKYLEVCEIEVYGDCPPPFYGLGCLKECSKDCAEQVCHYNGKCAICKKGSGLPPCPNAKEELDEPPDGPPDMPPDTTLMKLIVAGIMAAICLMGLVGLLCYVRVSTNPMAEDHYLDPRQSFSGRITSPEQQEPVWMPTPPPQFEASVPTPPESKVLLRRAVDSLASMFTGSNRLESLSVDTLSKDVPSALTVEDTTTDDTTATSAS